MRTFCVALFGEAERGKLSYPYLFTHLTQLFYTLGNPAPHTKGLSLAIQTILRGGEVWYFRVDSEGYSEKCYCSGFRYLEKHAKKKSIDALFLPGVSSRELIQKARNVCCVHHCLLLFQESDLFDYFTG